MIQPSHRIGILGARRGLSLASCCTANGLAVTAVAERDATALAQAGVRLPGCRLYARSEELLADPSIDAVLIATAFHQHTPLALAALAAGKHVLSECSACFTPAEGVALVEAVVASGKTYQMLENYPWFAYNQELRRLYRSGILGQCRYAECEYLHPDAAAKKKERSWDLDPGHWRLWLPSTYYCTHSVAPVMAITGARPRSVSAFVVPYDLQDPQHTNAQRRNDSAAVLMVGMDDGSWLKSAQLGLRGHGTYTRLHGNLGLAESGRQGERDWLHLRIADYDAADGRGEEKAWKPRFPVCEEEARGAGHGGGDFFTVRAFARALRGEVTTDEQQGLDVYQATACSLVGAQGWRSALAGGAPMPVPDLREASQRDQYRQDDWQPDPAGAVPCSVRGHIGPAAVADAVALTRMQDIFA